MKPYRMRVVTFALYTGLESAPVTVISAEQVPSSADISVGATGAVPFWALPGRG
jgi:hypothetical protein